MIKPVPAVHLPWAQSTWESPRELSGMSAAVSSGPAERSTTPFQPTPTLAPADRVAYDSEDLLNAAVALDILASQLDKVQASPTILYELTQTLLEIGELNATADPQALQECAASNIGNDRFILSGRLSRLTPSTPHNVAQALLSLEAARRILVRESRLLLEHHGNMRYFR